MVQFAYATHNADSHNRTTNTTSSSFLSLHSPLLLSHSRTTMKFDFHAPLAAGTFHISPTTALYSWGQPIPIILSFATGHSDWIQSIWLPTEAKKWSPRLFPIDLTHIRSQSVLVPLSIRRQVTYHKESGSLRFNYYAEVEEWLESHLQITLSCVLNVNPFSPEQELNKDTWTLFGWVHPMSPTQGPIQLTSDEKRRDEDADEMTWKQMKFIIFDLIHKSTDGDLFLSPHSTSLPDSICVPRVFVCLHAPQEWIRINTADHKVESLWPAWGASIPIQFRSSSAT